MAEVPQSAAPPPWSLPTWATLLAGLGLFLTLYAPIYTHLQCDGIVDHDYFNAWQLAVNDSLRRGHLLHWMPYLCGGQPGLGNPQSGALSPFNLLGLWLSPVVQFKIELLINAFIGLLGFLLLALRTGTARWTSLVGFVIWAGNGMVATRVLHGQSTYLPFFLVPCLLALLWPRGAETRAHWTSSQAVWATVVLLLILLQDGFHVLIYSGPLLLLVALGWAFRCRTWAPVLVLLAALAGSMGLALPRLLPAFAFLQATPRVVASAEVLTGVEVLQALLSSDLLGYYRSVTVGQALGFVCFVGPLPVALATLGLFLVPRAPSRWPWVVAALLGLLLMVGEVSPLAPWSMLHKLPLLGMVRAPFKFVALFLLVVAVNAQLAVAWVQQRLGRAAGWAGALLLLGVTSQFTGALWPLFNAFQVSREPPYEYITTMSTFVQHFGDPKRMYDVVASNQGIVNCYEPTSIQSYVPAGAPLVILKSTRGWASGVFVNNQIHITYETTQVDTLLIMQNYHPDWKVVGAERSLERDPSGLMRIDVGPGRGELLLVFHPRHFQLGLALSSSFVAALGGLWLWWRRTRR